MIIRTVTLGINSQNVDLSILENTISNFFELAGKTFENNSLNLRTQRIGLSPYSINSNDDQKNALENINSISLICNNNDIRWFDVPFNMIGQNHEMTNITALKVMKEYDNTFINFLATEGKSIDTEAIKSSASFVKSVSQLSATGFDNFRFGVSFNTKPNGAFFPFTHHEGENGFSLALELIIPIVNVIKKSEESDLETLRGSIVSELVASLSFINKVCLDLEKKSGIKYNGIDASLAPHPDSIESSIPYLMGLLGLPKFGQAGTAFLASYLTDIIKTVVIESGITATGFNGVMYSILEDCGFTDVSHDLNSLPVSQLLSLSSICGCGVDMLPVPGDISNNEIMAIMLDVAAKASWLDKPLGARVLPIPNKTSGDLTEFEHDFFVNTKIQNTIVADDFQSNFNSESLFSYSRDNK
jgi:uncharacterized protein (UPF0210 family)